MPFKPGQFAMHRDFKPRLDILPASQLRLWPELEAVPADFVLCGATGLALQLEHRFSEDFDFFSSSGFDPVRLQSKLPFFGIWTGPTRTSGCITRLTTLELSWTVVGP